MAEPSSLVLLVICLKTSQEIMCALSSEVVGMPFKVLLASLLHQASVPAECF